MPWVPTRRSVDADAAPGPWPASWLRPTWAQAGVSAVMTTREGGRSLPPFDGFNLRSALGDDDRAVAEHHALLRTWTGATPVWLRQVHGARVVRLHPSDAAPGAPVHEADASVSTEPGLACAVQVADCLPVLLAAPEGRAVAAAHAGWRGLAGGVVEAALAALCEGARCTPAQVSAWLGPCIGPRRFEVGADVLQGFGKTPAAADPQRFAPAPAAGDGTPRWWAHLPRLARDRLQQAGVQRIHGGEGCTVEERGRFFSYRRDGITGRMAAAVWIRR